MNKPKPRTQPSTFQVIQIAHLIAERNPDSQLSVESFFELCRQIVPHIAKLDIELQTHLAEFE